MDVKGLHLLWDGVPSVRTKVRETGTLLVHPPSQKWCEPNRKNAVANLDALTPVIRKFAEYPARKVPYLAPLQREIALLFEMIGADANAKEIYKSAWGVRKMLGFLKRKVMRKEVTKAGSVCTFLLHGLELEFLRKGPWVCPVQDVRFHELLLLLDPELKDTGYLSLACFFKLPCIRKHC